MPAKQESADQSFSTTGGFLQDSGLDFSNSDILDKNDTWKEGAIFCFEFSMILAPYVASIYPLWGPICFSHFVISGTFLGGLVFC